MSRAIELVEQIDSVLKIPTYRKVSRSELIRRVFQANELNKQALAELKKQPPAGKFTGEVRKTMKDWRLKSTRENIPWPEAMQFLEEMGKNLLQACVIIDRQAEDNKDLHREYQDLVAINLKVQTENDMMIAVYRRYRQYPELQAEIDGLKEQIAVIYDEAQAENVTLMSKNEQLQAEIDRLKKELELTAEWLNHQDSIAATEIAERIEQILKGE